jgi:hypothetical protein
MAKARRVPENLMGTILRESAALPVVILWNPPGPQRPLLLWAEAISPGRISRGW